MKKLIAILMVLSLVGVMMAGCAPKEESAAGETPAAGGTTPAGE